MTTGTSQLLAPRIARQARADVRDRKQWNREVSPSPDFYWVVLWLPPRAPPTSARLQRRASSFHSASVFRFSVRPPFSPFLRL